MKQLTALEILEETIAYYSEDPSRRASTAKPVPKSGIVSGTPNTCWYYTEDGRMCAVGRCLLDPEKLIGFEGDAVALRGELVATAAKADSDSTESQCFLRPQYRGHSLAFWNRLQRLHDADPNWDQNGLTEIGRIDAEEIRQKIGVDGQYMLNEDEDLELLVTRFE